MLVIRETLEQMAMEGWRAMLVPETPVQWVVVVVLAVEAAEVPLQYGKAQAIPILFVLL
jgi:hypothetical protein